MPIRATAAAKSMAPKTSIRGGGANDCTKTVDLVPAALAVRAVVRAARSAPCVEHAAGVVGDRLVEPLARRASRPPGPARPRSGRRASPGPSITVATRDRLVRRRTAASDLAELGDGRASTGSTKTSIDAAAGQPDRERVVVAVRRTSARTGSPPPSTSCGQLVDGALDAAAGDAADHLAVGGRPPSPRRAAAARCGRCRRRWPAPNGAGRRRTRPQRSPSTSRTAPPPSGRQPPASHARPAAAGRPGCARRRSRRRTAAPPPCPPASGAKPGRALCGLTQTTRCASRDSRRHLRAEQARVAALPAVGRDHHDRAAGRAALPPAVQELPQQLAQPGAAAPVRDRGGDGGQRRRPGPRLAQLAGDPGQPGAEREHLGAGRPGGGRRRARSAAARPRRRSSSR